MANSNAMVEAKAVAQRAGAIDSIAFTPEGDPVTAARDGIVRSHGSPSRDLLTAARESFHLLGAGPRLVAGSTFGEVVWVDWATGTAHKRVQAMDEGLSCLAVRADGVCAVGGDSCTLKLFGPDGNCTWVGETYKFPYAATFTPDGRGLLIATWDGYLYPIDLENLTPGTEDEPHRM